MSQNDHREVGQAKVEVGVPIVNCKSERMLFPLKALETKAAGGKVSEKAPAGLPAAFPANEIVDLGGNRIGKYQSALLSLERVPNGLVAGITSIAKRDQRSSVNDDGQTAYPPATSPHRIRASTLPPECRPPTGRHHTTMP